MTNQVGYGMSRRQFLASTSFATTIGLLAPHALCAGRESVSAPGLVEKARNGAASATITVDRLRGNVSVLLGAGGNIAAATDAKWGNGFRSPKDFIGDVFKGV